MWKISILISTILLLNLTIMKSETNNTNIVFLKFKTYYPYINSSNSLYEAEDYYFNVHLSKIYLEIQLGDKHNFETKTNQTLNVIVDLNEKVFLTTNLYFNRFTLENNNLLCKYNTSKSTTFYESPNYYEFYGIKAQSSFAKESFKIFIDQSLSKYNITKLNFINTINHNISNICGNIGLGYLHPENSAYNLIAQLYEEFNLSEYSFLFQYNSPNSDEGIFILGNMPHIFSPDKYNINNLNSFYSTKMKEPTLNFNEINIEGYKFQEKYDELEIKINPDIEGLEFPEIYFQKIEKVFFQEYYNKSISHIEKCDRIYRVIQCDEGEKKFSYKNIKSFPKISFNKNKNSNLTISFNGEDLFYKKDKKYFFKIVGNSLEDYFVFGRILLKKYTTVLNPDKRQIYFYINKENEEEIKTQNEMNINYKILIIVAFFICIVIFFPLGIYFGKKLFQKRGKLAYELNDGYDYSSKNENENYIIN